MTRRTPEYDFSLVNHGSICVLTPETDAGQEWFDTNLPVDDPETQFWCKGMVIEPRYVAAVVDGIRSSGLTVAGSY
jgi:hypothetical protein